MIEITTTTTINQKKNKMEFYVHYLKTEKKRLRDLEDEALILQKKIKETKDEIVRIDDILVKMFGVTKEEEEKVKEEEKEDNHYSNPPNPHDSDDDNGKTSNLITKTQPEEKMDSPAWSSTWSPNYQTTYQRPIDNLQIWSPPYLSKNLYTVPKK